MPFTLGLPALIIGTVVYLGLFFFRRYLNPYHRQDELVETAKARLLRKETHVSTQIVANGSMANENVFMLVFYLDGGGEVTFRVSRKVYDNTPENEWGTLAFQGARFLGFEFKAEGQP
jgi:hypothetical protein